jgi:hypothetical protein
MVESRDALLMEITRETGLDRMGEDFKKDEDANDGWDDTTPPTIAPPPPVPPAASPEEINDECPVEMIPEQEALVLHEVILANAKPEMPPLCL